MKKTCGWRIGNWAEHRIRFAKVANLNKNM